jgi:hypothetical protein
MTADGYDDKVKTYTDAVVQGSTTAVEEFMLDYGNEYFGCIVTELHLLLVLRDKAARTETPECILLLLRGVQLVAGRELQ